MPHRTVQILSTEQVNRKITRIAHEIHEKHFESGNVVLVGIKSMGSEVCARIADILCDVSPLGVTRFDLELDKEAPLSGPIRFDGLSSDIQGKRVILVDDVLNSGRTLMYATGYLLGFNPMSLGTVVLVDRFHRAFPIRADYVGLTLSTNLKDHVSVELENGGFAAYLK